MEDKFEIDDFEALLKETSNNFKLQPSRRVWSSIYNNVHPGNRFPSLSISILFGAFLLLVGHINNKEISTTNSRVVVSTTTSTQKQINQEKRFDSKTIAQPTNNVYDPIAINKKTYSSHVVIGIVTDKNKLITTLTKAVNPCNTNSNNQHQKDSTQKQFFLPNYFTATTKESSHISTYNITEKSSKLGWQVYATPSIAYGNSDALKTNTDFTKTDLNNNIVQQPLLGIEFGASMQYAILNRLKIKTGLQLNYTEYNNTIMDASTTSMDNAMKVQNEMYQISLPVGLEVKVLGNNNIQWNVGATVQPSFVMSGRLHGSNIDGKSYDTYNNALSNSLNNWNLNAGFETFVSYKTKDITWQLGPQVRYQFLPTYSNISLYNQHFMNYGLKLGISKSLH